MANFMTAEEIPAFLHANYDYAYLKYVLVNGEYRFGDATSSAVDHKSIAGGDPAESAAFVKISPDGLRVDGYSMSLDIGPTPNDERNLSGLLGIPIKDGM